MSSTSTGTRAAHVRTTSTRATITTRARPLRRFARWFSALLADDGFSERFAAARQRDEGLVGRVERQRRF
jgi:hypothetical protein